MNLLSIFHINLIFFYPFHSLSYFIENSLFSHHYLLFLIKMSYFNHILLNFKCLLIEAFCFIKVKINIPICFNLSFILDFRNYFCSDYESMHSFNENSNYHLLILFHFNQIFLHLYQKHHFK
jgi:hypothetical protein